MKVIHTLLGIMNMCGGFIFLDHSLWPGLHTFLCEWNHQRDQNLILITPPINSLPFSSRKLPSIPLPLPSRLLPGQLLQF